MWPTKNSGKRVWPIIETRFRKCENYLPEALAHSQKYIFENINKLQSQGNYQRQNASSASLKCLESRRENKNKDAQYS